MGTRVLYTGLRNYNPVFGFEIGLEEFVIRGSWRRWMIFDVLLDKVLPSRIQSKRQQSISTLDSSTLSNTSTPWCSLPRASATC